MWITDLKEAGYFSDYSKKHIVSFPDPADRYAYYMCVNRVSGMMLLQEDSFNDVPEKTIELMIGKLGDVESDLEALYAVNIIYELHYSDLYNVARNARMIAVMRNRCSRMLSEIKRDACEENVARILNSNIGS